MNIKAGGRSPFADWAAAAGGGVWRTDNALSGNGASWTFLSSSFSTNAIGTLTYDAATNTLYAGTGEANASADSEAGFGIYKSTDGGDTWTHLASITSVPAEMVDCGNNNIQTAPAYSGPAFDGTDRAEFAVTKLSNGKTRMYVGEGAAGSPAARFYRSDDVASGSPVFLDLTTTQNLDYCTGQCWYDNVVVSPAGYPDTVYLGGSYQYGEYGGKSNSRGLVYSTDAGASFTDVSWDATTNPTPPGSCCQPNPVAPNGMHPDQHALVVSSNNPGLFFDGSDGGLVRSSGSFADISSQCTIYRGLSGADLTLCQQLLSRVPTFLFNLNKKLSTLQFQSVSVAADNPKHLQGGTQDNGTFETYGSAVVWPQIIYGDGGQSGFSANNSYLRLNSFTGQANDVNFRNGDPSKWVIATGPIVSSPESSQFYAPVIADPNPAAAGTIFQGSNSVWRTQDWAGDQTYLETNCPEFTTSAANPLCGDFVQIGPSGQTSLTDTGGYRGSSRSGGNVAAIQRTPSDTGTMWAATTTGRVFISRNADASASSVTYTRLDTLPSAGSSPGRFVSGIDVDPANSNHAWIAYSSYSSLTPTTPGHIFDVTYDPVANDATWTSLDGSGGTAFPDFPATDVVRDSNGDLYASNDWGVLRLPNGSADWEVAGTGLPMVEVNGLVIVPKARLLYAATHRRSAWVLKLP